MEQTAAQIFAYSSLLQSSGLIGIAILFLIMGIRDIREERFEGYFSLILSVFFAIAHVFHLSNLPTKGILSSPIGQINGWIWFSVLLAPALIALFVLRGIVNFMTSNSRLGLVKLFFGLTLLCYLFMLGNGWAVDIKAIITVIWLLLLFKIELGVLTD
ncbi:MAG: hypothetical protein DRP45_05920 [Candidatus Zixiibacteriota bacterium]|nr:MAG: hypothetical protein DRP45_05920 [candidate division Zixibacteria bacterium]